MAGREIVFVGVTSAHRSSAFEAGHLLWIISKPAHRSGSAKPRRRRPLGRSSGERSAGGKTLVVIVSRIRHRCVRQFHRSVHPLRCVDAQPHHFAVSLRYSLYLRRKSWTDSHVLIQSYNPGLLANLYGASLWLDDRWLVADRFVAWYAANSAAVMELLFTNLSF